MIQNSAIRNVLIVGGGTAGWLAALHIKTALRNAPVGVTLIESPDVATIGVGEGTQPTLRQQLYALVVSEDECLRACAGSYKNGIHFVDWNGENSPREYTHPFFSGPTTQRDGPESSHNLWLAQYHRGAVAADSLAELCFSETTLMKLRKAPIGFKNGQRIQSPIVNYALHVDAAKLGLFLKDKAIERGVRHVSDHVDGVNFSPNGDIRSVITKREGEFEADFFVDCTGFHRLLMGRLNNDYIDFSPYLFNDTAITTRVPHPDGAPINSCTTSTALGNGWVWNVPLRERSGIGYVYSSRFATEEDARREFATHLGFEPENTEVIRFRSGCYRKQWSRNCVAIGLSSGFIEPLEATGIALITYSLYKLMELWPTDGSRPFLQSRFNRVMQCSYEWVRDFIVMHYCLSQRTDSDYWNAVKQPDAIPDSLWARLEYYEYGWPFGDSFESALGFRLPTASTACVLVGYGKLPRRTNPYVAGHPDQDIERQMAELTVRTNAIVKLCPDHADFLRALNR